jgi:hypothetical protein
MTFDKSLSAPSNVAKGGVPVNEALSRGHRLPMGHEALRSRLREMTQRLPPSLIFAGPSGIGKKLVAVELARELTGDKRSLDLTKPVSQTENIYFIQPDGASIKIEQARDAMHFLNLSREGRKLIFIIDEAHALGPQAANALLKSIEEPPQGVHFIFIAPSSAMLLSTIRSRSQVVRFAPLSNDEVNRVLAEVDPTIKIDPWLLDMSMGSPGALLEISGGQGEIEVIQDAISSWLEEIDAQGHDAQQPQPAQKRFLLELKNSLKERDHHLLAFRILNRKLAETWRARAEGFTEDQPQPPSLGRSASKLNWLRGLEFEKMEQITDLILESEADVFRNVDRQLLWEQLTSRLISIIRA